MTKTILAISAIAAAVLGAAASSAAAGQPSGQRILISDLDLSSPAGAARFQQRVDTVALRLCMTPNAPLQEQAACRQAVREEAVAKLGAAQQQNLRMAANRADQSAGF